MESLSKIVIALLKNSLDANSSSIAIRLCLELCWLQVLDDGDGISQKELHSIGSCCLLNIDFKKKKQTKQFAQLTSSSLTDIIGKCEEVLIESLDGQARDSKSHSRLFKQSIRVNEGSQRNFDFVSQYHYARKTRGTTVTLKNIFWEEPERQRYLSINKDYRQLLKDLRVLALIHYDRSFALQDLSSSEVVFKSKRLAALLPKYCELYGLAETDIDVTTCRKDSILAECFFSKREARADRDPVQLTFINSIPNHELLPIVNEILTQSIHVIDFLIIVTFPKNDSLTQQNEPIVKNCLLRCLNQYKGCLNRRKERIFTPTMEVMQSPKTPLSDQVEEKRKSRRPDDEDILYGLSQPIDNRHSTFLKCADWLQNNDFDVRSEKSAPQHKHGVKNKHPKIDFFDASRFLPQGHVGKQAELMTPEKTPPKKLPFPKFYAAPSPKTPEARPITQERHKPSAVKKDESLFNQTKLFSHKQEPCEKGSFLNTEQIKQGKLTFHCRNIPGKSTKRKQSDNEKKQKNFHAANQPPSPHFSYQYLEESLQFFDLENSNKPIDRTSFLNLCSKEFDVLAASPQPGQSLDSSSNCCSNNSTDACSTLPNIFTEPLFLEPILENNLYASSSPESRYWGNNMTEYYADFQQACWETIQHYKLAIEEIESSSSQCEHCLSDPFNREIETLRQPFHQPRDIYAKIGVKRC
ncbi:uncharacterized protein LOC131434740 [Malaya genurostris]|uniref:uncharacterized protein LOC131434740 n=1 Tax=Malaya genurostris TaxID=325434 RepID=UPI0026F3CE57|nr:uncharacterized protein LOC131434740 [Malaya genurostris]